MSALLKGTDDRPYFVACIHCQFPSRTDVCYRCYQDRNARAGHAPLPIPRQPEYEELVGMLRTVLTWLPTPSCSCNCARCWLTIEVMRTVLRATS